MSELITRTITAVIFGAIIGVSFFLLPPIFFSILIGGIGLYATACEMTKLFDYHAISFWLIIPLYPLFSFLLFILLNQQIEYRILLPIMIVAVAANDTGAYFIGKAVGKHKLCPMISPKKTWEGTIGGFCVTACTLLLLFPGMRGSYGTWIACAAAISFLATVGDLFESALKRRVGIKDTGAILPGHGGILDRFDSWLFVIVFFYVFRGCLIRLV